MRPDHGDAAYLWDMLRSARTVRDITQGVGLPTYQTNETLRLAVERGLEIVGEAASHVSPQFRQAHPEIPWRLIIAQRNVLIHGYNRIQHHRIWGVVQDDLPMLIGQLEQLVAPPEEA